MVIGLTLFAQTAKEFRDEQRKMFKSFKNTQKDSFEEYKAQQKKAYNEFKQQILKYWDEPKLSTPKKWVSYSNSLKTRTDVDFEHKNITLQTIASSPQEAKKKLQKALAKIVTIDTKTLQKTDPLEKKLNKIKVPKNVLDDEVDKKPILSTVIFEKKPSKKDVKSYVDKTIVYKNIKEKKSTKLNHQKVYSINVALPKDTMIKRSKVYYSEVKKQADRQELPVALVFAIMHSESSFNPRARSPIPAYGLMQIVPKTAGVDSYKYLYNEKKLVSSRYLYNSKNNITMGSAYLHILYYNYLKKIKNPDSRLYCTIAAYNTGAGNVAWAFSRTKNINKAATIINTMTPDEVYNKLLSDLRYDEPKHYLKKVTKRMAAYHKVYGT